MGAVNLDPNYNIHNLCLEWTLDEELPSTEKMQEMSRLISTHAAYLNLADIRNLNGVQSRIGVRSPQSLERDDLLSRIDNARSQVHDLVRFILFPDKPIADLLKIWAAIEFPYYTIAEMKKIGEIITANKKKVKISDITPISAILSHAMICCTKSPENDSLCRCIGEILNKIHGMIDKELFKEENISLLLKVWVSEKRPNFTNGELQKMFNIIEQTKIEVSDFNNLIKLSQKITTRSIWCQASAPLVSMIGLKTIGAQLNNLQQNEDVKKKMAWAEKESLKSNL